MFQFNTRVNSTKVSNTGGLIKFTSTGLIHVAGKNYSGMSSMVVASQQRKNAKK